MMSHRDLAIVPYGAGALLFNSEMGVRDRAKSVRPAWQFPPRRDHDPALEMPFTFSVLRDDAVTWLGLRANLLLEGQIPTATDTSSALHHPSAQFKRCCESQTRPALMFLRRRSTEWRVSRRATTGGKFWFDRMGRQQWRAGRATTSASYL
jgi:hypothetical protein